MTIKSPQAVISYKEFCKFFDDVVRSEDGFFADNPNEDALPKLVVVVSEDVFDINAKKQAQLLFFEEFNENRQQMLYRVGKTWANAGHQVVAAFLVSEAWRSIIQKPPDGVPFHPENMIAPSEDVDREEVRIIFGLSIDGKSASDMAVIDRSGSDRQLTERITVTFDTGEDENNESIDSILLKQFFYGMRDAYRDSLN